jgi:hypothetical protein
VKITIIGDEAVPVQVDGEEGCIAKTGDALEGVKRATKEEDRTETKEEDTNIPFRILANRRFQYM